VRDSFHVADGQDLEAAISLGATGAFFGLVFLPLEEVMREWAFWRAAEHDPLSGQNAAVLATMASVPPGWIQSQYACRGWIPLMSDRTGNYVGVDLDPGPGGARGQVIVFGRDFDRKCVLWKGEGEGGWGRWLAALVDELESGEGAGWESSTTGNSSDEEEEAGYTDYNGGAAYGEAARSLRLSGKYKGWTTLEAWWDKSVNRWEEMGMGLDVEEVERGLAEARRLTGADQEDEGEGSQYGGSMQGNGKGREMEGLDIGLGRGTGAAQVEVPGMYRFNPRYQPDT
jgi:cell wall assembly regulator SMI1